MAIVLDITTLPEITSFNGLKTAVELWLDRDDLADRVPYFVRLAEARFRRVLTRIEQQVTIALPGPLPDDFDSLEQIFFTVSGDARQGTLNEVSPEELRIRWTGETRGYPQVYAIIAGSIVIAPTSDQVYTGFLTYNRKIPALSVASQTNWLLDDHPDLYLFGALLEAEFYGWNDERLSLIKSAVDEKLAEINLAGVRRKHGNGPLYPRTARQIRGAAC